MEQSSSEDRMIVAGVVFGMIPACDGQTVGQTESIIAKTALCIASYADALSKMYKSAAISSFNKTAELSQRRPRDAPNIWVS